MTNQNTYLFQISIDAPPWFEESRCQNMKYLRWCERMFSGNMKVTVRLLALIALTLAVTSMLMSAKKDDDPKLSRVQNARARALPKLKPLLEKSRLTMGSEIFMRIFKESSELEIFLKDAKTKKFKLLKTYKICSFSGVLGPKQRRGDLQAPEGFYFVPRKSMNPASRFHLSFDLGYPNAFDRAHGRSGDYLMVHGNCISIGCYAMTDARIEEIYTLADAALTKGQKFFRVHCFPFRMTAERMAEAEREKSPWLPFWKNLKQGYDLFERDGIPPDTRVEGTEYRFLPGRGPALGS